MNAKCPSCDKAIQSVKLERGPLGDPLIGLLVGGYVAVCPTCRAVLGVVPDPELNRRYSCRPAEKGKVIACGLGRLTMKAVLAGAALVFLSGHLALASDDFVVWGSGGQDCATFAKDYKEQPVLADTFLRTWVMGYLSGLNEMSKQSGDWKNLKAFDLDAAVSRIKKYCDQHPLLYFNEQFDAMYKDLPVIPRAAR